MALPSLRSRWTAGRGRPHHDVQHHAAQFRAALAVNPESVMALHDIGTLLLQSGRPHEAADYLRRGAALEPLNGMLQADLRVALIRTGGLEEARAAWRKALDAGPPERDAWFGYAELCLFLSKKDEFRWARSELLARFRDPTEPHVAERVGRACLLLPGSEEELRQTAALTERATAAANLKYDWARFHFGKGLADYRLGRFDEAIAVMSGGAENINYIGPTARLVMAMALCRKGNSKAARAALAAAVDPYDWSPAKADNRDVWIPHILRREAESLIRPQSRENASTSPAGTAPTGSE